MTRFELRKPQFHWNRWRIVLGIVLALATIGSFVLAIFPEIAGIAKTALEFRLQLAALLALLLLFVLFGTYGIGWAKYTLKKIRLYDMLYDECQVLTERVAGLENERPSLVELGQRQALRALQSFKLPLPDGIAIKAIQNQRGSVVLILNKGLSHGIQIGVWLNVSVDGGNKVLGTVEIIDSDDHSSFATVVDRAVPEFWQNLEDRMDRDPSPPQGVALETYRVPGLELPQKDG